MSIKIDRLGQLDPTASGVGPGTAGDVDVEPVSLPNSPGQFWDLDPVCPQLDEGFDPGEYSSPEFVVTATL